MTTTGSDTGTTPAPAASAATATAVGGVPRRRLATRIGWTWLLLSSLALAAFAVAPYLTTSMPALAEAGGGIAEHYAAQPAFVLAAFYVHVVAGGIALLVSPFQFWAGLRDRAPRVHRWMGRTALTAIGLGGVAGLVLAVFGSGGIVGFFGFGTLAVLWLLFGWRGYRAIRRGDVDLHRSWMMRAFALTYAAVTLRLWIPLLILAQVPFAGPAGFDADAAFAGAYAAVPFLAWMPNLIVAEWLIRRRGLPAYRLTPATGPAAATPTAT
ncbi:DUF2306 domain-containing protein [Agromyces sp. SYSU T0242]|uniref:DUF2306 domain-containing protein n=1 Tax=Agromyces litoreus TaxID=3158561 RepID=UPI003391FCE3